MTEGDVRYRTNGRQRGAAPSRQCRSAPLRAAGCGSLARRARVRYFHEPEARRDAGIPRGKNVKDVSMPVLEWGPATPEGYDDVRNEALHVLNVSFRDTMEMGRVVRFTCARVVHFHGHLPSGSSQRVVFDLRGQLVSNSARVAVHTRLVGESARRGIRVTVEFLTS